MFFTDPNRDYGAVLKSWWSGVPAYTRFIIYVACGTYILSWVMLGFIAKLINIPILTIQYFQFWRLFTSPFIAYSLLTLLFEMMSYLPTACKTERRLGTAKYVAFFMINFLILELAFSALLYGLSFIPSLSGLSLNPTAGLWPLIMVEMVIRCNMNPDSPTSFFCFPIQIKAKYMPWAFLLLFSLFAGVLWDLLVGIILGYLHVYKLMEFTYISNEKAAALENSILMSGLKNITNFINLADAGNEEPMSVVQQGSSGIALQQPNIQVQRSQPFVPFGGQGYRLGGEDNSGPRRHHKLTEVENVKEDDSLV
ncbi:unnamed protein product [Blepharisma stoltei]|uniref:Derlin n=1 Tax=Blepharisma stoltei TaxID=1481888 RepID=A0AAU9J9N6_9CILI|nr:unnamed protein product [Blepharisma stoltei]